MRPYIVATVKNTMDITEYLGYVLYDLNTGEVIKVSYADLRGAMIKGVKVYNAKLNKDLRVVSKNVSLGNLPYIMSGGGNWHNLDKYIPLLIDNDYNCIFAKFNGNTVECIKCTKYEMTIIGKCIPRNFVMTDDGQFDCDSENDTVILHKNIRDINWFLKNCTDYERSKIESKLIMNDDEIARLEREAYDPNVVWDLITFDRFMEHKGWEYKANRSYGDYIEIGRISPECEVIHLPKYTIESACLIRGIPKNLKTIIFNSEFEVLANLYENEQDKTFNSNYIEDFMDKILYTRDMPEIQVQKLQIDNIFFQKNGEKRSEFKGKGLNSLIIKGIAQMPNTNAVYGLYCNCDIYNMAFEDTYLSSVKNSFIKTRVTHNGIKLNVNSLYHSFNKFESVNSYFDLILGEDVRTINDCFNECNLRNLELRGCNSTVSIDAAFNKSDLLKRIDLSALSKLDSIHAIGCYCSELSEILMNSHLRRLASNIGDYSTKLTELRVPGRALSISFPLLLGTDALLDYSDVISSSLNGYMLYNFDKEKAPRINLGTKFKRLTGRFYVRNNIQDIGILESIIDADDEVFKCSSTKIYDSAVFPNLNYVSASMFSESDLQYIVLDNNIHKIGNNALVPCRRLKVLILGENIQEFEASDFQKIKSEEMIKVYVVRNSKIAKKLMNNKKFIVIVVDSVQEARDMVFNSAHTSESKQEKFNIMLSGTEYEILTKEPYIKDSSFSYKLLVQIKQNEAVSGLPKLYTSKFRDMPLEKFVVLDKLIKHFRKSFENKELDNYSEKFIGLSNLFTRIYDNCEDCYSEAFMQKASSEIGEYVIRRAMVRYCLYIGANAIIANVRLSLEKDVYLLVIIIEDVIKFMVPSTMIDSMYPVERSENLSIVGSYMDEVGKTVHFGMCSNLIKGDRINAQYGDDNLIHNALIPSALSSSIIDNFHKTTKVIGDIGAIKQLEKRTKKIELDKYKLLLYDCINQLFIEVITGRRDRDVPKITALNNINIINIYTMDQIVSIDKKYFNLLSSYRMNTDNNEYIKQLAIGEDKKESIMRDKRNYDIDGDMNVTYIADFVYNHDIKSVQEATQKIGILKRLLDTNIYKDAPVSLKEIENKENIYKKDILTPVNNGSEFLMQFIAGGHMYVTGIVNSQANMSSKKLFKYSYMSLDKVLKLLYHIGYHRAKYGVNSKCGISDSRIDNMDEFYCVETLTSYRTNRDGIKLHIAIDKGNADTYLLGEVWDMDYFTLLRFKSYFDAMGFVVTMQKNTNLHEAVDELVDYVLSRNSANGGSKYYGDITTGLINLRKTIMEGFPNNYPYVGTFHDLMGRLAKQPLK